MQWTSMRANRVSRIVGTCCGHVGVKIQFLALLLALVFNRIGMPRVCQKVGQETGQKRGPINSFYHAIEHIVSD
eukprot:1120802-Amphidinium_carterae.1